MKFIIILGFVLAMNDISSVRQEFLKATQSENSNNELYNKLSSLKNPTSLERAYLAASLGLKAKYAWLPTQKLSYVSQSQTIFKEVILSSPLQIEIRYLRLSQEINIPSILGYNHMADDKNIIISQIKNKKFDSKDKSQIQIIIDFMSQNSLANSNDIALMRKAIIK